ncbi:major facilitator superfamily domain-containing protein [Lactarius quietus]|nr:major facilitator superfamily domain-containing protein [Lactarius quietus]
MGTKFTFMFAWHSTFSPSAVRYIQDPAGWFPGWWSDGQNEQCDFPGTLSKLRRVLFGMTYIEKNPNWIHIPPFPPLIYVTVTPKIEDDCLDEETTLILKAGIPRKPTPLPRVQIALLLSVWLVESIVSNSISPYINQLVIELPIVGGDGRKVGYYTGFIMSAHYAAEAVTVLYWNRLSDHIGRKPVLLFCLIGVIVSAMVFGLSRSFWALVFSRALHGSLKGYIGVTTSMMAELTDETNAARGFSMLPMSFSIGYAIGPFLGGMLSRPQDRWPHVFSHHFWAEYPYFFPCFVVALCGCASLAANVIYLKETVNCGPLTGPHHSVTTSDSAGEEPAGISHSVLSPKGADKPPPFRAILTRPVLISISTYAMLALLTKASIALIPLVWSTSVKFGGLGMSPASIGLWMSVYGCISGVVQYVFFPHLISRFGPRSVVLTSVSVCALTYVLFPFENLALGHAPRGLHLTSLGIAEMGSSAIYMYISSAVPNKRSLGAANGLAQTVVSIQRMAGPAVADWLFAFSLMNNVLGGNFAYVILVVLVGVGLCISAQLPRKLWTHGSN